MTVLAFVVLGIAGGALSGSTLYTWGQNLLAWTLPDLRPHTLAKGPFTGGGCADAEGVYVQRGTRLVYLHAPEWRETVLDGNIDLQDCLPATLLGHRGVLVLHRGMQLRFYEPPDWRYTELYSFYSASRQGGLLLRDIDGDGLPDILCGNYWAKSPPAFDEPWHIHAIELYNQEPRSATLRLAWQSGDLIVAQGELRDGLVTRFHKPADAAQLWGEKRLGAYNHPSGLAVNGNDVYIGEAPVLAALAYRDGYIVIEPERVHFVEKRD